MWVCIDVQYHTKWLTDEQRAAAGAGPDVIRLSIGLETVDDIIADLDQALKRAAAATKKAAE